MTLTQIESFTVESLLFAARLVFCRLLLLGQGGNGRERRGQQQNEQSRELRTCLQCSPFSRAVRECRPRASRSRHSRGAPKVTVPLEIAADSGSGKRLRASMAAGRTRNVVTVFRCTLAKMALRHAGAGPLLSRWRALLDRPLEEILEVLIDPRPSARELRHVTPFRWCSHRSRKSAGVSTVREDGGKALMRREEFEHAIRTGGSILAAAEKPA